MSLKTHKKIPSEKGIDIKGKTGPQGILISNLDKEASTQDVNVLIIFPIIKACFSKFGKVQECTIFYDKMGLSTGTARVIFFNKQDAINARGKLNGVKADGN